MIVSIKFKNKNKVFCGKTYDFNLIKGTNIPKRNDIVRMIDRNGNFCFYGTRVRVEKVCKGYNEKLESIETIKSNLND